MIVVEVVVAYGSLPDTAEMVIPTKILSMFAVEVVVAYGSLPDPAEVVIPRFSLSVPVEVEVIQGSLTVQLR